VNAYLPIPSDLSRRSHVLRSRAEPLPASQARQWIQLAQAGDSAARRALIEHYADMAQRLANRKVIPVSLRDDAAQEGIVALAGAIDRLDLGSHETVSGFFWRSIRSAIRRFVKRERAATVAPEDSTLEPVNPAPSSGADLLAELPQILNRQQRFVIRYHYGLEGVRPRTLRGLAERLGWSHTKVWQVENAALERLRDSL